MKTVQNIVLFLSVILCIGLVYISMFNVYQTDDYMCAYGTRVEGLWETLPIPICIGVEDISDTR
jgi:archaellum component FlaF (FlaF/FlaG flagellin family)